MLRNTIRRFNVVNALRFLLLAALPWTIVYAFKFYPQENWKQKHYSFVLRILLATPFSYSWIMSQLGDE
ncbi:hypothetical protein K2173_015062 [Erythroxylum novogranatense]|uniref:Uncharacterized protein n=1 Tax=Erythroxylum novogranatense TaxID=1862640 RepID=A0AAV8T2A4_9ROSI|nr:hypothetical protein K2173_015062 [Erythroxylum novogranatense]